MAKKKAKSKSFWKFSFKDKIQPKRSSYSKIENKFIFRRALVIVTLILLQFLWAFALINHFVLVNGWLHLLVRILSILVILFLIDKNDNPAYRISWIVVIAIFPIFGTLFYLFSGNKRPLRNMRHRMQVELNKQAREDLNLPSAIDHLRKVDPRQASLARYVQETAGLPVYQGINVTYYPNGEILFPDLLEALKQAEKYIFLEFFILERGIMFDGIFDILKQKASEGVDVRLIYDDFGCFLRLPEDFELEMQKHKIKALKFNPVKPIASLVYNTRDHRKYIIIDGKISFTGGLNIADEYINAYERFGYWKDTMIRLDGAANVSLCRMFLTIWNAYAKPVERSQQFIDSEILARARLALESSEEGHSFLQVFSDSPLDDEPIGENVYRDILNMAQDYVYIFTPYLVISYELQTAMILAAKRGVDVRLMTPGIPDKKMVYRITRSYYRPLYEAGVKIFEYSPGFLHAKSFVSDDKIAVVGTINLDFRSLYLHFETGTLLYYHPEILKIKEDFLQSEHLSRKISSTDIRRKGFERLIDVVLRLLAPFV